MLSSGDPLGDLAFVPLSLGSCSWATELCESRWAESKGTDPVINKNFLYLPCSHNTGVGM